LNIRLDSKKKKEKRREKFDVLGAVTKREARGQILREGEGKKHNHN
jgi:hypothetical protein